MDASERKTPGTLVEVLDTLQTVDGVLASGVCFGNSMVVYRNQPAYPLKRDQAKAVWRTVRETFERLHEDGVEAERVHWSLGGTEEGVRLLAVYRDSVAIGVLLQPATPSTRLRQVQDILDAVSATRLAA
ncbi:MAG TPA: hypothetical protein VGO93_27095 [Candidatus Xenobia bacterium]|jgi:hypothetical protein